MLNCGQNPSDLRTPDMSFEMLWPKMYASPEVGGKRPETKIRIGHKPQKRFARGKKMHVKN